MTKYFKIRPIDTEPKQIIYNEENYRAYADLNKLITTSRYFLDNYFNFYKIKDIFLPKEPIEITEQAFKDFILICQKEKITIKDSIIFQLYYLSIKYEVPDLTDSINNYISENKQNLAIKSLNYKMQIQDLPNYNELKINIDKDYEINIISSNLIDFAHNDDISSLPIDILYSIFSKFFDMNKNNFSSEIIDILFNCLDKYNQKASVLFSHINFDNINDLIMLEEKLISKYENVFDFSFLNCKSIVKTHLLDRKNLEKQLQEKDHRIAELERQHDEMTKEKDKQIQEKDQKNAELERQHDEMIKEKEMQLQEKENQIIELEKQLQKKCQNLHEKEDQLKNNDVLINNLTLALKSKENYHYFEGGDSNTGICDFLASKQDKKQNKFDKDPEFVVSISTSDKYSIIDPDKNKNTGIFSCVYGNKKAMQHSITIELEKEVEAELIKIYSHKYNTPYSFSYQINEQKEEFVSNDKLHMFNETDYSKRIYCIQLNGKKLIKKFTIYPKNDKATYDTWPIIKRIELFKSKNDSKGIFESLIEKREDKDPHKCGVFISASVFDYKNFFDINNNLEIITFGEKNPYFKYEITKGYAILTGFRFRKISWNKTIKYRIIATDDDKKNESEWTELYNVKDAENDDYIPFKKFEVKCPLIKFIKLIQTEPAIFANGNNSEQLKFYHIEFFGHLILDRI